MFPGAVNAAGTTVAISAYNNATARQNLFNQTDLIVSAQTGRIGHTLLFGTELGRQETDNFRETGFFSSLGANVTTFNAPLASPTTSLPLEFRQNVSDADNQGVTTIASVYAQDQVALSRHLEAVAGLRFDSFNADVTNNRTATAFSSDDGLVSPRARVDLQANAAAVALRQLQPHLPAARRRTALVVVTDESGARSRGVPKLRSRSEVGCRAVVLVHGRDVPPGPQQRHRAGPDDPTASILVDAQRTKGLEVGSRLRHRAWSVAGGYAYQDGEITRSISASAQAGAALAQLPKHSISLWNKYDFTPRLAAGLGVIYRGDVFTSTDNLVVLPSWTRLDAALYYNVTSMLRAQMNIENLFDENYYLYAQSNTNITPGSPRAVRFALTTRF